MNQFEFMYIGALYETIRCMCMSVPLNKNRFNCKGILREVRVGFAGLVLSLEGHICFVGEIGPVVVDHFSCKQDLADLVQWECDGPAGFGGFVCLFGFSV